MGSVIILEYYKIAKNDLNSILKTLLSEKVVDKVLMAQGKKSSYALSPKPVDKEEDINSFPINQYSIHNFNRTDSASKYLHKKMGGALKEKVAVIGLPADARALVELSKILQINLENIFTIVVETQGIIIPKTLDKLLKKKEIDPANVADEWIDGNKFILKMNDGSKLELEMGKDIDYAESSSRDYRKTVGNMFDIAITTQTLEPFSEELIIKVGSDKGNEILQKSGVTLNALDSDAVEKLNKFQDEMNNKALEKRKQDVEAYLNKADRINDIAKCTMCGMCINSCPVCFCVSCVLQKQRKEKVIDKLSYQLTRVSHVGDRCVDCGKCSQNCPPGLPLALYFEVMNDYVQDSFGYIPGTDPGAKGPRTKASVKDL